MEADGELARVVLRPSDGAGGLLPKGDDGMAQLQLYARLLENFVEGYRVAARGLAPLLRAPMSIKDVVKRALPEGQRMFLAGEIARREAISRPLIENAYASFVDQGYVARADGKIALTESYASATALATIEKRILGQAYMIKVDDIADVRAYNANKFANLTPYYTQRFWDVWMK